MFGNEHFTIFREGNTKCSPLFVYKSFISGYGLLINDFALLTRVFFILASPCVLWISRSQENVVHNVLCINQFYC